MNASMSNVLLVIAAGFVLIRSEYLLSLVSDGTLGISMELVRAACLSAMIIISSLNTMSSCALSLEGNCLWILKSMPVRSRDVLLAKTLPQIIVSAPIIILSAILVSIALKVNIIWLLAYILIPILSVAVCAVIGTVFNVAFPKFEFENEVQPIKQSLSVFLSMLASTAVSGFAALALILGAFAGATWLITALVAVLLILVGTVFLSILSSVSARRYESF